MAGGGSKNVTNVEGAIISGLVPNNKLAILITAGQYERHVFYSDLAATFLSQNLFDPFMYWLVTVGDPVKSLARQAHRVGTAEWTRKVYEARDPMIAIGAASQVLGVDVDSKKPVMKKDVGIDDQDVSQMLNTPEIQPKDAELEPAVFDTQEDGVSLAPESVLHVRARIEENRRKVAAERRDYVAAGEYQVGYQPDRLQAHPERFADRRARTTDHATPPATTGRRLPKFNTGGRA